ncbi:Hemolysin A (chromatophore) [Paulinella micropora]|uniref:Hemolysin A n=1 Tax=Paulinella micropora TaxID=1928728 RepID=A0A1L5YB96_9EUKA|nr:hemolysin A [Paulinella micropora]AQX44745.1 Hemolysin A [Paulinella micropora]BBL85957.1 Hemolysin A [Paulinella micropora]
MTKKERLDLHLLNLGLVADCQEAQQLILAGKVRDPHGHLLDKPGLEVSFHLLPIIKKQSRFVSRGGEKLAAALEYFPIQAQNRVCLDGGISTGGFSDCLLQNGARCIYGIDVGYGQLAWGLRIDPRIILKERTNLRYLKFKDLYNKTDPLPDLAVLDLSFISLASVLPALKRLVISPRADIILLVKPQFEVGREFISKGGVVQNVSAHLYAIKKIIAATLTQQWRPIDLMCSPITGPAGNHEYLLWASGCDSYPKDTNTSCRRMSMNNLVSWESVESLVRITLQE